MLAINQSRKDGHAPGKRCSTCPELRGGSVDMSEVVNLISNLGFPIACVVALFWLLNKQREEHKEESAKFTEAINNNTLAITKLVDKLGG